MPRRLAHAAILLAVGAACTLPAFAASLKVGPARFTVQDVKPGRSYDLYKDTGVQLTLYNDDSVERTWDLSVNRPSARGSWECGYSEIPDAAWCRLSATTISVQPGGQSTADLFLQVPDNERYFNQHWAVTIGINGASGRPGIALAADVRVLIETTAKSDIGDPPDGPLGLVPAKVCFENPVAVKESELRVRLCNNTDKPHRYALSSLFADVADPSPYLTAGFVRLPHPEVLHYPMSLSVPARETATVPLRLALAQDDPAAEKSWEELVLVTPDEGSPAFIRVQVLGKPGGATP